MIFKCSRNGLSCAGCPIIEHCEYIELTEELDPYSLYEKGRADAIDRCTAERVKRGD